MTTWPYDQFLTWQMAGDLLPLATQEQRIATGFQRLGMMTNEAGADPEENRWMQIFDRVQVTSTVVLGLTMECAQCHDHKYDPLSMKDYYQMAAFFDKGDEFGLFARFCNGTPPPCSYIYQPGQEAEHQRLKQAIATAETNLQQVRSSASERFKHGRQALRSAHAWRQSLEGRHKPRVFRDAAAGAGHELRCRGREVRDYHISVSPPYRTASSAVKSEVKGVRGQVLEFPESKGGVCEFPPELCYYRKYSPFTFSFWMKMEKTPQRGVILHRSRAGVDATHRGYELMFLDGKLTATLAHFFPGNAIRVQAVDAIDFPDWRHVAMVDDGSSRADGLRLYVDGQPVNTRVIRDTLHRDIDYRVEWGDRDVAQVADGSDAPPILILGYRNNDTGLHGTALDELRAYDRALSPVEVTFREWQAGAGQR